MKIRPITWLERIIKKSNEQMRNHTKGIEKRYPLIFSSIVIIGLMSVMYGFESIIKTIPYLANKPFLVFVIGFLLLLITGSLYKKNNNN